MSVPLTHLQRRSRITCTVAADSSPRWLSRAALAALLCLAAGSLSCSRQRSAASRPNAAPRGQAAPQTAPAAQQDSAAPHASQPPQPATAQPQAISAFAVAPIVVQQQAQVAGQLPDRVLNSGHFGAVTAIAFTPDRQRVATAADDKTIRIWDLAASNELRVLTGYTGRIDALAFSPDGARLASASADGVRVWDPATGNSLYAFTLPSKFFEQVSFSSDGQLLVASAGADNEGGNSYIEVHDAATGARIRGITLDWNHASPLLITPDGRLFSSGAAGEDDEYVSTKIWELRTGRELKTLPALFSAFSPDGRWGASLEYHQPPPQSPSTDRVQINLWDIPAGRQIRTIDVHAFDAAHVAFTPDGTHILAVIQNGQNPPEGKFFEVATGRQVQSLPISSGVDSFSGDGKWLATASGSSVVIWDLATSRELEALAGQLAAQDIAFSPDGKLLITGGAALGVWDMASGKLTRTVQGATQGLVLSPDGRWLVANPNGSLEIWETRTWMRVTPSPPAGQNVWWIGFAPSSFAPTQAPFAALSAAGVRWWQVGTGAEARWFWGATFPAALSPDGKILATAALRQPGVSIYDRPNVSIWDVATGRLLQTFAAHEVGVSSVAFSPDGKWLETSGQDSRLDPAHLGASLAGMKHSMKLWDTAAWQVRMTMPFVGIGGGFGRFSPDGRMFAIAWPNSITLYDVPDGRAVKTLSGAGAENVRFSPDGHWLGRGSGAGVALWNLAAASVSLHK